MIDQSVKSLHMSPLLKGSIFGMGFEKLKKREIVYRSREVTILHFASFDWMKELFTLADCCIMEAKIRMDRHVTCGKVFLRRGGRRVFGFIVGECGHTIWVLLET